MICDFHSHILPGIDDGSASPEESIALLRLEAEQGVRLVAATPHFYAQRDHMEHFLERRAAAADALRRAAGEKPDLPDVILGAEVYYFSGISQSEQIRQLALEDTGHVLIEMPSAPWTEGMYRELAQIPENLGLTPIIAHVDRYLGRFLDHGIPERLAKLPVRVQANASFFLHRSTAHKALRMLKQGQIHVLGSDCHNTVTRVPNLAPAVERIRRELGREAIVQIRKNEREILMTGRGM